MYPGQKKSAMTWISQIFFGFAIVILVGTIIFGVVVTRNGGSGFCSSASEESDGLGFLSDQGLFDRSK